MRHAISVTPAVIPRPVHFPSPADGSPSAPQRPILALGAGALASPAAHAADTDIQILATNDFHGRILDEGARPAPRCSQAP